MTGTSTSGSVIRRVADIVSRGLHLLASAASRVWHATGALAELLSDAGHGPRRWRERSDIPNPYAGVGPPDVDEGTGPGRDR